MLAQWFVVFRARSSGALTTYYLLLTPYYTYAQTETVHTLVSDSGRPGAKYYLIHAIIVERCGVYDDVCIERSDEGCMEGG